MRPHPRGASTSPSSPRAWATCSRCGFVVNHYKLNWQHEWTGTRLTNLRILVCDACLDDPQRQLGTIVIPPDPMPILNARPEQYALDEQPVSVRVTVNGDIRVVFGRGSAWVIERIVSVPGNIYLPSVASANVVVPPYIVSADNGTYSRSPYWAFNNDYGKGALVNGVNFTETITVDTAAFPIQTRMDWNWPSPNSTIRGFPAIIYGTQQTIATPSEIVVPTPKIVDNFTALSVAFNYSVLGPAVDHTVIIDAWLRSSATAPTQANLLWEIDIAVYFDWAAASSNDKYAIKYTSGGYDIVVIPNAGNLAANGLISISPYTASTNLFNNTAMAGSVNGTPGTAPTNTSWFGAPAGLTRTIVGSGTTTAADGTSVNYVDTRWAGTAGAAGTIRWDIFDSSGAPATNNQIWEGEIYLALTAGSWGVSTVTWGLYYYDNSFLIPLGSRNSNPLTTDGASTTGPTSSLLKWRHTAKTANAATTLITFELDISIASGQVVDFTLRTAAPKAGLSIDPQLYSGTVDMRALLSGLKTAGVIVGTEFIAGIEFGPEPVEGVGGISVSDYSVVWSP